jgi:GR25 family glycosyltransferase involved in LPS biosynthesis
LVKEIGLTLNDFKKKVYQKMFLNIIGMKTVYKKSLIIFLLIVLIYTITNLINIKIKINKSRIIQISNNHVNASFVTPEYIKNIKNTPNEIIKYKNSKLNTINDYNNFMAPESDLEINKPFIETFESGSNTNPPRFMKKIDKILYINLDHRKDRIKQINREFTNMHFPKNKIQRISAVREKYNGHIGCCKSHIKTMNEIIENNYKYTMVFEDDFVFAVNQKTLDKKISEFFNEYKDDWDIIQLASVYTNLKDTNKDYIKKVNRASTSSAYIINRKFAETLRTDLKNSLRLMEKDMEEYIKKNNNIKKKKFETPFALDQHWYGLQKRSRWYLFKPYIGKQGGDASGSSIMNKSIEGFSSRNIKYFKLKC